MFDNLNVLFPFSDSDVSGLSNKPYPTSFDMNAPDISYSAFDGDWYDKTEWQADGLWNSIAEAPELGIDMHNALWGSKVPNDPASTKVMGNSVMERLRTRTSSDSDGGGGGFLPSSSSLPLYRISLAPLDSRTEGICFLDQDSSSVDLTEGDDFLYDLQFGELEALPEVQPDGFLQLDSQKAPHDGVLYLNDDRKYVAVDTPFVPLVADPAAPYISSCSPPFVATENDVHIYSPQIRSPVPSTPIPQESPVASEGLLKSKDLLSLDHLTREALASNLSPLPSIPSQKHKEVVHLNLLSMLPKAKGSGLIEKKYGLSREQYFKSTLREEQLERYRHKKQKRVYHRAVDVKRSAKAKSRERNARGRFVAK